MYKLKFTILQFEILRLLCMKAGKQLNARRIAQYLEVSQTAVSKALPLLEREKFVKVEKDPESGRLAIELNRENKKAIEYKKTENLRVLYESGFAEFLERKFSGSKIILFGDYSSGKDVQNSPVEIAIKSRAKNTDLAEFEKKLERKILIKFCSASEFAKHSGINLAEESI